MVQPGELIAGKYRVERVLAVGGMGVVMAARHEELDQQVALKILRQDAMTSEEAVARFVREARTAARLQSEHVARVFDVGTLEHGVPFMVMEYLNGLDLQQVVDARGPLPIIEAVDYVLQALEAIAEAHALGIVHRDLKPSNLFLAARPDGSGRIKVLDFGISKEHGLDAPAGVGLTSTKQVIGSPGYMSPEQMLTPKSVDGRTDVWAIGVLLYELLTGESPFRGETVAAVMTSILHNPLPKAHDKRADIPAGLERVIERCLSRDLAGRYMNVAEVARDLVPFGSSWAKLSVQRIENALGPVLPSPAGTSVPPAIAEPRNPTSATWAGLAPRERQKRRIALVGAVAVSVGLFIGGGLAVRTRTTPQGAVGKGATLASGVEWPAFSVPEALSQGAPPAQAPGESSGAPQAAQAPATSASAAASGAASPAASSAAKTVAASTGTLKAPSKSAPVRPKKSGKKVDVLGDRQ